MTEYGALLRRLVDFTGSKLYAVADEVGYDVSYISKWCNKDLLPAPKTAHTVDVALGRFFGDAIRRDGAEAAFDAAFPGARGDEALEQRITALLAEAYDASAHHRAATGTAATSEAELLIRHHEILDRLRTIPTPGKGDTVVCTIDLLTLLKSRDFPALEHLFHGKGIHIHAALDLSPFQQGGQEEMGLLYGFLSRNRESFITLYDGAGLEREGLLAVGEHCGMLMSMDGHGELDALVMSRGTAGAQLRETAMTRLSERPILLSPARPEDMRRGGYRTDFYSRDQFQFFSPYGFEFLLPPSVCEPILQAGGPAAGPVWDLRRLFITWEEVFQKSHIDFYLLKSSLLRYLDTGELLFADIPYHMSYAQRLEHLENIKDRVLANHDIRFFVLDDDALPPGPPPGFGVYLSPKKLFLKSPGAYLTGEGPMFYTVQSDTLIQAAQRYLEHLQSLNACRCFDHRDVPELERRYGGMIYRMLTMQQGSDSERQTHSGDPDFI